MNKTNHGAIDLKAWEDYHTGMLTEDRTTKEIYGYERGDIRIEIFETRQLFTKYEK